MIDAARDATGNEARRVVMTGGGTLVDPWVQAMADATALPVECALVPEGAALGAALLARIAAGLDEPTAMREGRWARTGRVVEPDARWVGPVGERYARFVALAGRPDPARSRSGSGSGTIRHPIRHPSGGSSTTSPACTTSASPDAR